MAVLEDERGFEESMHQNTIVNNSEFDVQIEKHALTTCQQQTHSGIAVYEGWSLTSHILMYYFSAEEIYSSGLPRRKAE